MTEVTIEGFIAWVKDNGMEKIRFQYLDNCDCANAQYHKAMGVPYTAPDLKADPTTRAPKDWIEWAAINALHYQKCTFGCVVELLEAKRKEWS